MQYGIINTSAFDTATPWLRSVSDEALGIALAMPSGDNKGVAAKTGGTRRAGVTAGFLAMALDYARRGEPFKCPVIPKGVEPVEGLSHWYDNTSGAPIDTRRDNKMNNIKGLVKGPGYLEFIAPFDTPKLGVLVAVTPQGVAYLKQVNADLGKAAGDFTRKAYDQRIRAAKKAARDAAKAAQGEPVENELVDLPVEAVDLPVEASL